MPSTVLFTIATYAITSGMVAVALGVMIVASAVMSKMIQIAPAYGEAGNSPDLGNRQQVPPATDNKLPLVYGTAFCGGTITDLSISENNQELYYVLSICEVTSTNTGQTPDVISFGNIYYGGKLVTFEGDGYTVASLTDTSTSAIDVAVAGKIQIYLYNNGSSSPTNSPYTAIEVMQTSGLTYTWDANKLMTNCAFAILHLSYNVNAGTTGIQQTKFQVTNSLTNTGDCIYDYFVNTTYGGAIPTSQINTDSLDELTAYSNELITFEPYTGGSSTQARFKFNGVVDTKRSILQNLQDMASSCDCLIKYNEITAQWGVITQKPDYDVAMALNDSNLVSAIQVTPLDMSASYNIAEIKYPDSTLQDSFSTVTIDLAQVAPELLFANEPVNKQSVNLPLVNNNVTAQYIATRLLKAAREDLQVQCDVNFSGIQLEAGDIVTITNTNYGWEAKPFRINRVVEQFNEDGAVLAKLTVQEFNPTVYDDTNITQFTPASNSGLGSPTVFGTVPAPTVGNEQANATNPSFQVTVTTSTAGVTQYAEVWYSAFSSPTSDQRIFAGTTAIQSSGNPYDINTAIPAVTLANIESGNWYFFSRMVNSLATSQFSPASALYQWRPSTFQYVNKYIAVAYGTSSIGAGFSFSPTNKTYYGLASVTTATVPSNASDYTWYLANPNFGTISFLLYSNRTGRKFSFATGPAGYAAGSASFVPTQITTFDPSVWLGLPDGTNIIDLDVRTGQVLQTGTTTVGTGQIGITNNPDGTIVAGLQQYLDFGGPYVKTSAVATLTIDIYGRVVGFEEPDDFYFTKQSFTATSAQTVFTVTRGSGYISGQCLVLQNGLILDTTEYTDTGGATGTVTLSVGATTGDIITIISVKSSNVTTGVYVSLSRNTATLTAQSTYTASGFTLVDGLELLFLNGTVVTSQDYNITGQDITFIAETTGDLQIIQWSLNNLSVANGTPVNVDTYTIIGQSIYPFNFNPNAFNLWNNGVMQLSGTDYTTATNTYTLTTVPTSISNILTQQTFTRTGAV